MRHTSSVVAIFAVLVAACASSRTTPPQAAHAEHAQSLDVNEEDDADGDVDAEDEAPAGQERAHAGEDGPCPTGSVLVETGDRRFCIDKYEASLVEVAADGLEKPYPHYAPVDGHAVRAVSVPNVFPQGFISEVQASDACAASQKRLCTHVEWKAACMGPQKTKFPYGDERRANVCHDSGKSAVAAVFGVKALTDPVSPTIIAANSRRGSERSEHDSKSSERKAHVTVKGKAASTTKARATSSHSEKKKGDKKKKQAKASHPPQSVVSSSTKPSSSSGSRTVATGRASTRPASIEESVWNHLNDPALGKVDGALAKTGSHPECANSFGAVDMVGNLHEWVATDPNAVHGTFAGGYYLDTSQNGDGCQYRTVAHAHDYHDYSTGFRCCADPK